MTESANPGDKGLRVLLEALTTISYLRGQEVRAASIAEYALDQYENAMRCAGHPEGLADLPYFPGLRPEQRCLPWRRIERRYKKDGPPVGLVERRQIADRRVNPDRRCQLPTP